MKTLFRKSIFCFLILSSFNTTSFAQESAPVLPPRVLQRRPAPPATVPPPAKPFSPARTPISLLPFSFLSMRFSQTQQEDLKSGVMIGQIGLNMPASSYLYSSYSFRSTAASTKGTTDLQTFSLNLIAYTPQLAGFGLAGNYLSSGAGVNSFRSGLYYRYFRKTPTSGIIITPHLLFNTTSSDFGRFLMLWSLSFSSGLFLTEGSVSHTWNNALEPKTSTSTFDIALMLRIYQNIRFVVSYGTAKVSSQPTSTNNTGIGIDIREVF